MPFGVVGRTRPEMRQMVGFCDQSMIRGTFGFGGEFGARRCNQWDFTAYVCDSAATQPSSQITLGKLVMNIIMIEGSRVNEVHSFKYLGAGFNSDALGSVMKR